MSRRPQRVTAPSTIAWLSAALVTSARAAAACPPAFSIRSTIVLAPRSLTSTTSTRAPSLAMASAVAAPIPEAAPVTMATRSCNRMTVSLRRMRRRRASALEDELGHRTHRGGVAGDHQRRRARGLPLGQPLAKALTRPAECDLVDERVGHRRGGLVLAVGKVGVLDALGSLLVAVATGDVVVEVPTPRAHAAHVERQARLHRRATGGDVVTHDDRDHRHDVEVGGGVRAAGGLEALAQPLLEQLRPARGKEDGDPAIGNLRGERNVL